MRINCINYFSKPTNYNQQSKKRQNSNNLTFEGRPHSLPKIKIRNVYDAMVAYGLLSYGGFLDSSDDDVSPENKLIRNENLSFLDEIKTSKDKKAFISHYSELTGFPNLEKVSEKIEKEFILAVKKSEIGIEGAECIAAGYDETCSVGKRRAFPGSDLDKAFIVLVGTGNLEKDKEVVQKFKANLWNNVDQRVLSFNHDISFPSIYTVHQIIENLLKIEKKTSDIDIDKEALNKVMQEEFKNLEKAAQYNIKVSENFEIVPKDKINDLSKEEVKNFGYFLESLRDGKPLIQSEMGEDLKKLLELFQFYNFSNMAQMKSMKNAVNEDRENKTKIILRENFDKKFESWDVNKQFNFVKTLIKYTCEDNDMFKEYFTNDRDSKKAYKPLLNILTKGDRDIYNRLEFSPIENGLRMKYAENKTVDLYQGYANNVMWIETNDSVAIEQVLYSMEKLKQKDLFSNVDRIQTLKLDKDIDGFYEIQYKTLDNQTIYERLL